MSSLTFDSGTCCYIEQTYKTIDAAKKKVKKDFPFSGRSDCQLELSLNLKTYFTTSGNLLQTFRLFFLRI